MDFLTRLSARYLTPQRRRYAWLVGIMLWAGWLISIVAGPGLVDLAGQVVGADFLEFYAAGVTVRLGESDRLYDVAYQSQLQQAIIGPQLRSYYGFITPPFLAWLFAPLSALPYLWSFALWSVLGLAALWASLRLLGVGNPRRAGLWALTWFPIFAAISYGQNSLLSLALLCLVYRLWRHARLPKSPQLFMPCTSPRRLKSHCEERLLRRSNLTHGRDCFAQTARNDGTNFSGQTSAVWAGLTASLLLYKPQLLIGVALLWLLEWASPPVGAADTNRTEHPERAEHPFDRLRASSERSGGVFPATQSKDAERSLAWPHPFDKLRAGSSTASGTPRQTPLRMLRFFKADLAAPFGLAVGGGLLAALCFWLLPEASRAYVTFARTVLPNLPAYQDFPLWNLHTLWGFWRLLLPAAPRWADGLYWLGAAAGLVGFVRFWRRHRSQPELSFAAAICVTLWVTPHAMIYDWAVLLIPAVLVWQAAAEHRRDWTGLFALVWLAAFFSGPLTRGQLAVLPAAVQISVPALLAAFWLANRVLRPAAVSAA